MTMKINMRFSLMAALSGICLCMQAQTTPKFVVSLNDSDSTAQFLSGITFSRNQVDDSYIVSDGNGFGKYDLSRIKSISRYHVLPKAHVYSGQSGSGSDVQEVRDDGTVVLSSENDVPSVGEIIVSDEAPGAPDGFLYKVEEVRSANGLTEITTSPACLNEVIGTCHEVIPLNATEVENFTRSDGKVFYPSKTRAEWTVNFIEIDTLIKVNTDTLKQFEIGNLKASLSSTLSLKLTSNLSGTFTCIKKEGELDFEKIGFELKGGVTAKLSLDLNAKISYKINPINLGKLKFKKLTVWVSGVPISLKPVVDVRLTFEANGEASVSITPVDVSLETGFSLYYHDVPDPITGEHFTKDCFFPTDEIKNLFSISGILGSIFETAKDVGENMLSPKFAIKGNVKVGISPMFGVWFYGREDTQLSLGFSPYLKLLGELSAAYSMVFDDVPLSLKNNLFITDKLDIKWGIDADGYVRLPFQIPFTEKRPDNKYEIDTYNVFEGHLWSILSLFPTYHSFYLYPEDDAMRYESVKIRAEKERPSFVLFEEDDFGFAYREKGTEDWKYMSLKEKYANSNYGTFDQSFTMEYDLPTSELKSNATFFVAPYTHIETSGGGYYIFRKGGSFKTGGDDSTIYSTLDDIPGVDL